MRRRLPIGAILGDFERWILSDAYTQLDRAAQGDPHAPGRLMFALTQAGVGGAEAETAHIAQLVRMGQFGEARRSLADLIDRGAETTA